MSRFAPAGLAMMLAVAAPAPARAGIEDSIGLGPRATALGGAYAARPGDWSAAYYNPAGLAARPGEPDDAPGFVHFAFGAVHAQPLLSVTGVDGEDVPLAAPVHDTTGALVGIRWDAGHAMGVEGLAVGIAAYVPSSFFAWSIHPDDDVQWAFLTDRTQRLGVHLAVAWRVSPVVAVGVGFRLMFDAQTFTYGRVTSVEQTTDEAGRTTGFDVGTQLGEDVRLFGKSAPVAGLLITPTPTLHVGLTLRERIFVDDWGNTRIQGAPVLGDLGYNHRFAHYFQPRQAVLGIGWAVDPALTVSADLTYSRWSEALTTNQARLDPGRMGDTLLPAAGVSWAPSDGLRWMAGYQFVLSPLDNFGGPTNLLDNDQHVGSAGVEWAVEGWSVTAALRLAWLVERQEQKDWQHFASDSQMEANPGFPSYTHGGIVPGLSLGVSSSW